MNSTVKSFSIVTAFSVATRFLSFLFKIWMSRSLGAETVGLYQISMSVVVLLFSLTAGAPTVLSRKVAAAVAEGDMKRQNALTTASVLIGVSVAAVLCGICYSLHGKLGFLFADDRCVPIFEIMLPALLTSTLYSALRGWFWGRKSFLSFSSTELLDEVFKILLSVTLAGGFVASLTGAIGVALAFTLSDVLCVLILLVMYFASGGRFVKPQGTKEIVKATVPLSAVRIMTSLTASLTALVIPARLVASGMTTALATAEYGRVAGMALPLIMAPVTLVSALSVVLIPDVAEMYAKGNTEGIKAKLQIALSFSAIVCSLFFVIYLPLGEFLGALFFGDAGAGKFVSYCAAIIFPLGLAQVTTPMLNSLGMEKHTFLNYVLGAACTLPCIFFLPKLIGVYSMAVASGAGFLVTGTLNVVALLRRLGAPEGLHKALVPVLFSLPLAVLGLLTERLTTPYLGGALSFVVNGFYLVFFFIILVSAFGVIDIKGFLIMLKPSRKSHNAKERTPRALHRKRLPARKCGT